MRKSYNFSQSLLVILIIFAIVFGIYYFSTPHVSTEKDQSASEFSVKRASNLVEILSQKPHYVGSTNHEVVKQQIVKELQNLGLTPEFQSGYTMTEKGTLVFAKNIFVKIPGYQNTKALLLLSHYDSAPHSFSHGAADDASGIATILESIRAFRISNPKHKNDIVILFTDAEEIGLNGAALFCAKNKLANQIGLALNFEARGTAGPSYMLMETTNGNQKMVDAFAAANVKFPSSNSLMYSIYKMLPNDTDLTVFRELKKIQGFNFAFIDNHYFYHTEKDDFKNLDQNSLAQQGSYLLPLLKYFTQHDISSLQSSEDKVYFNFCNLFFHYSNNYIVPLILISAILFVIIVFLGIGKRVLKADLILKSTITFIITILVSAIFGFLLWKAIVFIYPQYQDILQGYTYNGNDYVFAFIAFAFGISFMFYSKNHSKNEEFSKMIFPVLFWLICNTIFAFTLKGASFLIIPVLGSILMLGIFVYTQKSYFVINLILALPTFGILVPFLTMFPIGLGLKILYLVMVLAILIFVLLLPIFGAFQNKKTWGILTLLVGVGFLVKAHLKADFSPENPKPNSLVFYFDADKNQSFWTTYDKDPDTWVKKQIGKNPENADVLNTNVLYSKYLSEFTWMKKTPNKNLKKATIVFKKDSIATNERFLKIIIYPNRKVNRYDIYTKNNTEILNLKSNGVPFINIKSNIINQNSNKILSYYVVNNRPLILEFSVMATNDLDLELIESAFDLFENPLFKIENRPNWTISMPFVINNATIIKQKIEPNNLDSEILKDENLIDETDTIQMPLDSIIDVPVIKPKTNKKFNKKKLN